MLENPVMRHIGTFLKRRGQRAAEWLTKHTRTWSKRRWTFLLVAFCVGSLIICSCVVRGGLVGGVVLLEPGAAIRPLQQLRPAESAIDDATSSIVLARLLKHKQFLDSLREHDKVKFDVLLSTHPRLTDSLDHLIQLLENK